jgi:hypothetical protein
MSAIILITESAFWTAVCMWAAPNSSRRFWTLMAAGLVYNLAGFAEGAYRQKEIQASTPILLNTQVRP